MVFSPRYSIKIVSISRFVFLACYLFFVKKKKISNNVYCFQFPVKNNNILIEVCRGILHYITL